MADTCVDFRSLLEQKDREIIGTHEREVALLQQRYNLALLDSRDLELEEYDALLASIEGSLKEKELALEELESALLKSSTENMEEREKHKLCQKSMSHKICDLEKKLEILRQEGEMKVKKQEDQYKAIELELKSQVLESERKVYKMEKRETDFLTSFEKQAQISQEFEAFKVKLQDIELKLLNFEDNFRKAIDEKSKKLQDLCHEVTKGVIEEEKLRRCYNESLEKLRHDARAAENEQTACILLEIDKIKQLSVQLNNAQTRFEDFKNMLMERLLVLTGKVQCLEAEAQGLRDFEVKGIQKIENKYLEFIQCHDFLLQEARREASNWREECELKQRKCMDLEKRLSQVSKLEAENQHLQENVLELKGENERIQKVVATLRLEMESLQDATTEENQKNYRNSSIEMQTTESFQKELQALKAKISSMSSKLDGIDTYVPTSRKRISSLHGSITRVKNSPDVLSSDEDMASRLAELEQTQGILKAQLEATIANAARIADERDILMELNNSLHADLNRTIHCSCTSQHYHGNEDKGKHDGVCCHELNCKERGQNNAMQCCSSWIRSTESAAHKECCHPTCSNLNKLAVQEPNVNATRNKLHVEGNMAKYHDRISASEVITHKGTMSQHANFRHLLKRQESNKPKLRNYNIKDDDMQA